MRNAWLFVVLAIAVAIRCVVTDHRIHDLRQQLKLLQAQMSTVECAPVFNAPEPPMVDLDPQPTPVEEL